jgi:hypothetical protein
MKLKSLLEGYAWDRKPGKALPTMQEVQTAYEEKQKQLKEGKYEVGTKVKVISPELADYNKVGVIQDEAPSGNFYLVKLKTGLAYFHHSDLRHQGTTEKF